MKNAFAYGFQRKIRYINPRFQGGMALAFAIVIVAMGAVFGWRADRYLGDALRNISLSGHYSMKTAFEVLRDPLAWHLCGLLAGTLLAGTALFLLLLWATCRSVDRAIEALRAAGNGDLSTPCGETGLARFAGLGEPIDAARSHTLDSVLEIRREAESLAGGGVPPEEFLLRWAGLKERIRRIAP